MPDLSRARRQARVRWLADGRIVVAGGQTQSDRVAVAVIAASGEVIALHYQGYGDFLPADNYEIFEPTSQHWRESASAPYRGDQVAIMDDGRMAVLSQAPPNESILEPPFFNELSQGNGNGWSLLEGGLADDVRLSDRSRLLVVGGELLLVAQTRAEGEHQPGRDLSIVGNPTPPCDNLQRLRYIPSAHHHKVVRVAHLSLPCHGSALQR